MSDKPKGKVINLPWVLPGAKEVIKDESINNPPVVTKTQRENYEYWVVMVNGEPQTNSMTYGNCRRYIGEYFFHPQVEIVPIQ